MLRQINLEDELSWFEEYGLPLLITVGIAIIVTIALQLVVRRFRHKLESGASLSQELNIQRIATLTGALSAAGLVLIWVVAVLLALGTFHVPLGPFFASAGIAGVALGFGAQSIVRDTLSGFFILLENQFGVADVVEVRTTANPVSGKVESLTLRVTMLRDFDGTLHIIPNGNIQLVSNKSRGWARAIVDVRVAYGEDLDRLRRTLEDVFTEIRQDERLGEWIQEGPSVLGIETLADYAKVVRAVADTQPSKRWDVERALRERITRRLDAEGFRTPIPPTIAERPGEPAR